MSDRFRYTEDAWAAIAAAAPGEPDAETLTEMRRELEYFAEGARWVVETRLESPPHEDSERIVKAVDGLLDAISWAHASSRPSHATREEDLVRTLLAVRKARAHEAAEMHAQWLADRAADMPRARFLRLALSWWHRLGGGPRVGNARGPLIRFLLAVAKPPLGERAGTAEALRTWVRRESITPRIGGRVAK